MGRTESERAERDGFRPSRFLSLIVVFAVSFLLCANLMPLKQAKANPLVIPFAAAAAEAAGISVEAWALGMTAIIAGTTGLALIGEAYEYSANVSIPLDQRKWNTPGWKDWDDMTPQEKHDTGATSNYEYYLQWLQAWCLYYGLLDSGSEGGDGQEPQPPKFDQKLVKMVRTLGISTGGLAIADYRYPTEVKNYLFSPEQLNIPYDESLLVDGYRIKTQVLQLDIPYDAWFVNRGDENINQIYLYSVVNAKDDFIPYVVTISSYPDSPYLSIDRIDHMVQGNNYRNGALTSNGSTVNYYSLRDSVGILVDVTSQIHAINALYSGEYIINTPNGTSIFSNNQLESDLPHTQTIDYGQEEETPNELARVVPSVSDLNDYLANINTGLPEGQQQYIVLPDLSHINNPTYNDFVQTRNENQTTTDPDNPVNPDTGQDIETPSNEDFRQRFQRIIAQPFEAAFPFCLIEDARQLFIKLDASANAEPDFTVTMPLSDFNVQGAQQIKIDASDLKVIGGYVKIAINILWVSILIAFAYKLFLKRGE